MPAIMFNLSHRISKLLFPRYIPALDKINHNAKALDWFYQNRSLPHFPDIDDYFSFLAAPFASRPITYLEFGVYRGDSMRKWLALNTHPKSRFFGFDTFSGLPEKWNNSVGAGAFDVGGSLPDIADPRVTFHKGLFQQTLPSFLETFRPQGQLVINADADLYSSTLYLLTVLDCYLVPGTLIMFDEFASALHEFRAWNDYTSAYIRRGHPVAMTSDAVARAAFVME